MTDGGDQLQVLRVAIQQVLAQIRTATWLEVRRVLHPRREQAVLPAHGHSVMNGPFLRAIADALRAVRRRGHAHGDAQT